MPKAVITPDQDTIVSEIEVAAPPERVFQALIDPQQLLRWWSDESCTAHRWEMDARPGGRYRYSTRSKDKSKAINSVTEFECEGEILEFVPPRLLVYTWIANWHADRSRPTVVRWELTPSSAGTKVKVTHSGLAQEAVARKDYSGGWPGVLQLLKNFTEKSR